MRPWRIKRFNPSQMGPCKSILELSALPKSFAIIGNASAASLGQFANAGNKLHSACSAALHRCASNALLVSRLLGPSTESARLRKNGVREERHARPD